MHLHILQDMLILLACSVLIVFLLQRLKISSIIGFLVTGMVIGPFGFKLVHDYDQIEILSEIGVILLLFVIGMELSIKQLISIRRTVFIGGILQVGLTVLVASVFYRLLGHEWNESVFVGFLFSMSSTAIVLKTLQDRQQISAPHARNALAILIFQDIIVVPMMLVTPLIAGESEDIVTSIISLIAKSLAVLVIAYLSARFLVPRMMYLVAKTNSKELFLLVTITLCFAVAYLTSIAGLSLALGAFIAGLIISESEYSHQATSIILPFRELFTSFFFVSVGMLLDLRFFYDHLFVIMGLVLFILIVKTFITSIAIAVLNYPIRTVLLTGLALFQVGEFAFILSKVGLQYELLTPVMNQYFLSASIVSMILTPFVIIYSGNIVDWIIGLTQKVGLDKRLYTDAVDEEFDSNQLKNHLVIVGYGINGSNLAKAAALNHIPYVVIEMNAEIVKRETAKGVPILFGDASQEHILDTVHLHKARAAVLAISDDKATRNVLRGIREHSDSVYLVVRTRYVKEISELIALGADKVVPEEYETSLQIFSCVLQNFLVPEDDIERLVEQVRGDNYDLFNKEINRPKGLRIEAISDFNITCLNVQADSGKIINKSIQELDIRKTYGINILGIRRKDKLLDNVSPSEKLKQGDKLYVLGDTEHIEIFSKLIR